MAFLQRFGEKADALFHRLVIHRNGRAAEQLVELEFEPVLFRLAYLKCESHTSALRNSCAKGTHRINLQRAQPPSCKTRLKNFTSPLIECFAAVRTTVCAMPIRTLDSPNM